MPLKGQHRGALLFRSSLQLRKSPKWRQSPSLSEWRGTNETNLARRPVISCCPPHQHDLSRRRRTAQSRAVCGSTPPPNPTQAVLIALICVSACPHSEWPALVSVSGRLVTCLAWKTVRTHLHHSSLPSFIPKTYSMPALGNIDRAGFYIDPCSKKQHYLLFKASTIYLTYIEKYSIEFYIDFPPSYQFT